MNETKKTRLNACLNGYAAGGCRGGARWSPNNYAVCPTCGKRVRITRAGYLRAHGTRGELK